MRGSICNPCSRPLASSAGPGLLALDLKSSLDDLIPTWSEEQTATLLREWGAYYDLGKQILLEKSPSNLVRYPFLRHVFPEARFLFILRHPACVALATRKLSRATVPELLLHCYVGYRRLVDAAPLENALVLRYEDIVGDQRAWFDRVFALAGVRPAPLEETISDHNKGYLDEWAANYGQEAEFVQRAFPEMIRFFAAVGYSLEPPFVSPDFRRNTSFRRAGARSARNERSSRSNIPNRPVHDREGNAYPLRANIDRLEGRFISDLISSRP